MVGTARMAAVSPIAMGAKTQVDSLKDLLELLVAVVDAQLLEAAV